MAERRTHDELFLVSRHRTEILATSLADARDLKPSSEGTQLNGPSRQWQIAGRSLPLSQMLECQSQPRALTYHARDERAYISGITFPLGRNDDRHSASATFASGPVCRRSGWRGPIIRLSASGFGPGRSSRTIFRKLRRNCANHDRPDSIGGAQHLTHTWDRSRSTRGSD